MIAKRINHKGQCGHAQTAYARRACRKAMIAALAPTMEVTVTTERFTVITKPNHAGVDLHRVLDTASGQEYDCSFDRAAMVAAADRMNAHVPAPAGPRGGSDTVSDVMGASFGLASHAAPGTCHYCGLNKKTCDCN